MALAQTTTQHAVESFFERIITVRLTVDKTAVDIIDQTLLPNKVQRIQLRTKEEMRDAIATLKVRGAPAIGVAAAYGLAVLAAQCARELAGECGREQGNGQSQHHVDGQSAAAQAKTETFLRRIHECKEYLASARPTAVNLFWALNRMEQVAVEQAEQEKTPGEIAEALYQEADRIREEDVAISLSIGEIGFSLLEDLRKSKRAAGDASPIGVLTHCNAGTLATAKYGTATAPLYRALENGWQRSDLHVYCDETRPLLQGARLTSFELSQAGIATTVQCDNAASSLMASGKVDIIFVGCDRVARNGDVANKIGTSGLAILAKHYDIPFYVCAPTSTLDLTCENGNCIHIEQRSAEEVTTTWYQESMVPQGVDVYNPAFDVTDSSLITGIITERGLMEPDALSQLVDL